MTQQFILSLISGIAIGGVAGYLGSLMMEKRMALVAGPLGHLTLPGVALALIYGFDIFLGAFPFVILGIVVIWFLEVKTRLPIEALTAIVFATGVAIALLFLPIDKAEEALIGNITTVGWLGTLVTVILSLAVFITVKKIFSVMVLINVSEDLAKVEKVNVKKFNFIYLMAVAVVVALGVKLVGGLLTAALVAIPAATARNLCRSLRSYALLSFILGILAPIVGLIIYKFTDFPAGVLVILTSALFFMISVVFRKK
jgi:ABC-type Mn2+/Zn2+ transport system permease subunit